MTNARQPFVELGSGRDWKNSNLVGNQMKYINQWFPAQGLVLFASLNQSESEHQATIRVLEKPHCCLVEGNQKAAQEMS